MATNWITPVSNDILTFLNKSVFDAVNLIDPGGAKRADLVLSAVVARIRGAVVTGNRVALSITPSSVPPESRQHTLVLAADALSASMPQVTQFTESPAFERLVEKAEAWITNVEKGITTPTNPTDPDPAYTPHGPEWGDMYGVEQGGLSQGKIDVTTD